MDLILIITSAFLPAILLWFYIWKKDTQKEPTSWLVKAMLLGVAICIPVAIVESGIETLLFGLDGKPSSLWGTTTLAFIVAALPEETFKLFALWMVLRKNPHFDEHLMVSYMLFVLDWDLPHSRTLCMCLARRTGYLPP